ncbi:MAG: ABC transporter permease, partial [Acidobacteriota bacterium]
MRQVIALAVKDLRVLPRVRTAFFFTLIWPIIVAVMFGYAFSGSSSGTVTGLKVALVDDDASDGSRAFATRLHDSGQFVLTPMTRAEAETAVRRGQQTAFLAIKPGFGERSQRMFYGSPREIEVGNDPSRGAEAAMIEGLLMKAAAVDLQRMFSDPAASAAMVDAAMADADRDPDAPPELRHFLGELKQFVGSPAKSAGGVGGGNDWQPLKVTNAAVTRERVGPAN